MRGEQTEHSPGYLRTRMLCILDTPTLIDLFRFITALENNINHLK